MSQQLFKQPDKATPTKSFEKTDKLNDAVVHLLPCNIEYEGMAPVKEYFVIEEENTDAKIAHFRGRELRGKTIKLPNDFIGYVGQKDGEKIKITKQFDELTYWNREVKPSDRDSVQSWFSWPEIADTVSHSYIF